MSRAHLSLLMELSSCPGPPGGEQQVARLLQSQLEDFCDIRYDGLGSLLAEKPGRLERPRLLLCGHMDEIGFMVQSITDKGWLRLQPLGSWNSETLAASRLVIHTANSDLPGVIPAIPPHFKKEGDNQNKTDDILADVGVSSRQEAQEAGVMLGDLVTPAPQFDIFGLKVLANKAWDEDAGHHDVHPPLLEERHDLVARHRDELDRDNRAPGRARAPSPRRTRPALRGR